MSYIIITVTWLTITTIIHHSITVYNTCTICTWWIITSTYSTIIFNCITIYSTCTICTRLIPIWVHWIIRNYIHLCRTITCTKWNLMSYIIITIAWLTITTIIHHSITIYNTCTICTRGIPIWIHRIVRLNPHFCWSITRTSSNWVGNIIITIAWQTITTIIYHSTTINNSSTVCITTSIIWASITRSSIITSLIIPITSIASYRAINR